MNFGVSTKSNIIFIALHFDPSTQKMFKIAVFIDVASFLTQKIKTFKSI